MNGAVIISSWCVYIKIGDRWEEVRASHSETGRLYDVVKWFWGHGNNNIRLMSSTCRFSVFVVNRMGEILKSSSRDQWRHVPGRQNPADLDDADEPCSRVLSESEVSRGHRRIQGPAFLKGPK